MAIYKRKPKRSAVKIAEPPRCGPKTDHDLLCEKAELWLQRQGCKVTFNDRLRTATETGEQPDAIGWRSGVSILVECKTSRSDFLADAKKSFRKTPEWGMGDWRVYMCPPDLIYPSELPEGWGLVYVTEKRFRKIHGLPKSNIWSYPPFSGSKKQENIMLLSALRRLQIRGRLPEIYDQPWSVKKT